jgi:bifunctional DNA-binding transcriptional regulator/antitoxin component of YhaV-PrlF toxin-antitoxin module
MGINMAKRRKSAAVTVGDKGRVTLSEDVRKHLGITEGDVVFIELTEPGVAEIVPAAVVPRSQVWFFHAEVQQRMAEAHADIAAGRTTSIHNAAELRAHLSRLKKPRASR